jgi:hypothetical protein
MGPKPRTRDPKVMAEVWLWTEKLPACIWHDAN